MKTSYVGSLLFATAIGVSLALFGQAWSATPPEALSPQQRADAPVRGSVWLDKNGKLTWPGVLREQNIKRGLAGPIGVLFYGDALPHGWIFRRHLEHDSGKEFFARQKMYKKYYGKWHPANFAQGDASTLQLLQNATDGEFDGISPKVVVLEAGGDSLASSTAKTILSDDTKIVAAIRAREPHTKILIVGLFPFGRNPKAADVIRGRAKIAYVNQGLAKLDNGTTIRFLNLNAKFLQSNGAPIKGVFAKGFYLNGLYLTNKGYKIWAEGMQPLLAEMMK